MPDTEPWCQVDVWFWKRNVSLFSPLICVCAVWLPPPPHPLLLDHLGVLLLAGGELPPPPLLPAAPHVFALQARGETDDFRGCSVISRIILWPPKSTGISLSVGHPSFFSQILATNLLNDRNTWIINNHYYCSGWPVLLGKIFGRPIIMLISVPGIKNWRRKKGMDWSFYCLSEPQNTTLRWRRCGQWCLRFCTHWEKLRSQDRPSKDESTLELAS